MQQRVIRLFNKGFTGVQISKETGIGQTKVSEIISKSFKKAGKERGRKRDGRIRSALRKWNERAMVIK